MHKCCKDQLYKVSFKVPYKTAVDFVVNGMQWRAEESSVSKDFWQIGYCLTVE